MNMLQIILALQTFLSHPDTGVGTGVLGPLQPLLIKFMSNTPLELTTSNQVVIDVWGTILAIADAFFLLLIIIGSIQMMVSNSTGTLSIPLSEFVPKIFVTVFLMNLSFFFGQDLLIFNNVLCSAINANLGAFFTTINNGARITQGQGLLLYLGVLILLNFTLIRLLFQAFERLVLWNALCPCPTCVLVFFSAANVLGLRLLGPHVCHRHLYPVCAIFSLCAGPRTACKCWANGV